MARWICIFNLCLCCALLSIPSLVSAQYGFPYDIHTLENDIAIYHATNDVACTESLSILLSGSQTLDLIPPYVTEANIDDGEKIKDLRPEFRISYHDDESGVDITSVRVILDGMDITRRATVLEDRMTFSPDMNLEPGDHFITIRLSDCNGNRIIPSTIRFSILEKKDYIQMYRNAGARLKNRNRIRTQPFGNHPDPTRIVLSHHVPFTDNSTIPFGISPETGSLKSGSVLSKLRYDAVPGAKEDLVLTRTDLIDLSSKKPGTVISTEIAGAKAQAFAMRPIPGEDFQLGSVMQGPDRNTYAGSITRDILENERLTLSLFHLGDMPRESDEPVSFTEMAYSSAESALLESKIFGEKLKLKAEYCFSRLNNGTLDDSDEVRDRAWKTQVSGKGKIFSWGVASSRIGPAFMALDNPSGSSDRTKYSFNSSINYRRSTINLNFHQGQDYVDVSEEQPLADIRSGTLSYTYTRADWPLIQTSYSLRSMEYIADPDSEIAVKNNRYSLSFGTTYTRPKWSISPTYTLRKTHEEINEKSSETDTYIMKITAGLNPSERLTIRPIISYTSVFPEYSRVRSYTYQSSIGGTVRIIPSRVNLDTAFSYLNSHAKDDSVDTTAVHAKSRIYWILDPYIRRQVEKSLSINGRFTSTKDHVINVTTNEWDVSAMVNFGLPDELLKVERIRGLGFR